MTKKGNRSATRVRRPATGRTGARPRAGPERARSSRPNRRPAAPRQGKSIRRLPWIAVGAVVAVVGVMLVVFATRTPSTPNPRTGSAATIAKVTSVPASTLAEIGVPPGVRRPPPLPEGIPPTAAGGKPMVLYIGAEYCPYCAAERWPMVVALSRFGTFTNLSTTTSAPQPEVFPDTATLSFYGSSYTSEYLALSTAETQTNQPAPGGGYTHLQDLTPRQRQLFTTYDTDQYVGSQGGIPFIMIGNRFAWAGASYDPALLQGMSFDQIANQLADPQSEIAQAIDGTANQITAMVCLVTGNQPAQVCSAPSIRQEQARLIGG
jgi:hypothetical protein